MERPINGQLLKRLREDKHWSREELAIGCLYAVAAVILDLFIGEGTLAGAGIALGIIGTISGLSAGAIGYMTDRKP